MAGRLSVPRRSAERSTEAGAGGPAPESATRLYLVCAWCRRIRLEGGAWEPLEAFLARGTGAAFTHGMCPECFDGPTPL